MSEKQVKFANPEVLRFAELALPQGTKPGFICDVVSPTGLVVRDVRGKQPVDVLKVSSNGDGYYAVTRRVHDPEYDNLFRVVHGNVIYCQQQILKGEFPE